MFSIAINQPKFYPKWNFCDIKSKTADKITSNKIG